MRKTLPNSLRKTLCCVHDVRKTGNRASYMSLHVGMIGIQWIYGTFN